MIPSLLLRMTVRLDWPAIETLREAIHRIVSVALGEDDGVRFCRELPARAGVAAIPAAAFYDDKAAGRSLVRFAYCKKMESIEAASAKLLALRKT